MIRPVFLLGAILISLSLPAPAFSPVLPTDNDALFQGRPDEFFMFTDRDFEGQKTHPWEGGAYGFTRGPQRLGGKIILARLHEGIDIQPVRRDAADEPLDEVRAIESGRVVHASDDPRDSNYGRYVVIEHTVEGAPVYSIYAHLANIGVQVGQKLHRGERIGRLGYTGAGIDRRRAHLHLEIAILWNDAYEGWHAANFSLPNKHGIYNGMNLMGLDAAEFYLQQRADPDLTLPDFIKRLPRAFSVRIPDSPAFQLPSRYPWLVSPNREKAEAWTVTFTAAGFPIEMAPAARNGNGSEVEWLAAGNIPYATASRSLVDGPPGQPRLGESGGKLLQLLTFDPAAAATPPPPGT